MKAALRWVSYVFGGLVAFVVLETTSEIVRGFLLLSALVVYCWYALDKKITQRMDGLSRSLEALHDQRRNQ